MADPTEKSPQELLEEKFRQGYGKSSVQLLYAILEGFQEQLLI